MPTVSDDVALALRRMEAALKRRPATGEIDFNAEHMPAAAAATPPCLGL
jgi:hypothetical protein